MLKKNSEIIVYECDLYENNEDLLIGNGLPIKTKVKNNTQLQLIKNIMELTIEIS